MTAQPGSKAVSGTHADLAHRRRPITKSWDGWDIVAVRRKCSAGGCRRNRLAAHWLATRLACSYFCPLTRIQC
jgi:hypothetical protein